LGCRFWMMLFGLGELYYLSGCARPKKIIVGN
jgi:hypothetical protein